MLLIRFSPLPSSPPFKHAPVPFQPWPPSRQVSSHTTRGLIGIALACFQSGFHYRPLMVLWSTPKRKNPMRFILSWSSMRSSRIVSRSWLCPARTTWPPRQSWRRVASSSATPKNNSARNPHQCKTSSTNSLVSDRWIRGIKIKGLELVWGSRPQHSHIFGRPPACLSINYFIGTALNNQLVGRLEPPPPHSSPLYFSPPYTSLLLYDQLIWLRSGWR